jgi:hypothetical protein
MARKPSDVVQVKFRLPERLRRLIEVEAKKNKRTQAQEMVLRLERSFVDQGIEAVIEQTVLRMEGALLQQEEKMLDTVMDEFNRVYRAIGRPDLVINLKKGEGNG